MKRQTATFNPWVSGLAAAALTLVTLTGNAMTVNVGGDKQLDQAGLAIAYNETFDIGSDPATALFGLLIIGTTQDGTWTGKMADGVYRVSNDSREDSIRYLYFDRLPDSPPGWTVAKGSVSVKVRMDKEQSSAAGLLFALDPATRHYSALFLLGNGSVAFYQRDESGLNKVMSRSIKDSPTTGFTELAIVARGEFMDLYANGRILGSVSYGSALPGYAGLIYAGKGAYLFDDFTVYTVAESVPEAVAPQAIPVTEPPTAAPVNPLAPTPPKAPFSGRFIGEKITLELQPAGAGYHGKIIYGAQEFPVRASADGDNLQGTFRSEGHDFEFSAQRQNDRLYLKTADEVYLLAAEKHPQNPLAAPPAEKQRPQPLTPPPTQALPKARPPAASESRLYQMRMDLKETGESKHLFFRVDIEPMGQGHWLLKTLLSEDGREFSETDDFLVNPEGGRIDPEMRPDPQRDAIIYYWFPGTTEIDGQRYQVSQRGGFWIYRSTDAPERVMVFEQASGRLVSAKSCVPMGCAFLGPAQQDPE